MIEKTRDLTIEAIYKPVSNFVVGDDEPGDRFLDEVETYNDQYRLSQGVYFVTFKEGIPVGRIGEVTGATDLYYASALLEAGRFKQGEDLIALLHCTGTTTITEDATIAQLHTFKTPDYFQNEVKKSVEDSLDSE